MTEFIVVRGAIGTGKSTYIETETEKDRASGLKCASFEVNFDKDINAIRLRCMADKIDKAYIEVRPTYRGDALLELENG